MAPSTTSTFVEATAIKPLSSHTYEANFRNDWCIGTVPHGGYVTSCFLEVAKIHFKSTLSSQNQPHTIYIHLDFLRRTNEGPARFTVKDVKLGRQTSIIHVTLSQGTTSNPREEVVAYITNSNLATESGITFDTRWKLSPPTPLTDLRRLKNNEDETWACQTNPPFQSFRRASHKAIMHFPRSGQVAPAIGDEWIRLRNGERFTNATLGYVSDMWPMPAEQLASDEDPYAVDGKAGHAGESKLAAFWYPTLLLNLDVKKALPEEGVEWLFVRVATKQVKNGRMDLEVVIMDEKGEIVALSHHVTLALPASRNMAERRKSDGSKL